MNSKTIQYASPSTPARDTWSPWTSRLVIWCAAVVLGLLTIAYFAGSATLASLNITMVDGGVALLWLLSGAGIAVWAIGRWTRDAHWAFRLATAIGIGFGLMFLILLALGLAGWINGIVVWTIFFAGLALGAVRIVPRLFALPLPPAQHEPERLTARPPGVAWEWAWVLAAIPMGTMFVAATVMPGRLWYPDPHPYDVMSYHLQVPREWYELGRIEGLRHNVFSYFPMGVEVHFLAMMHLLRGPWSAMYGCQFVNVWLTAALVLGIYGAGRTLRPEASRGQAILAAAVVACVPWVPMLGSVAYAEPALMLLGGMSIAWLLRSLQADGWRHAVLAGVLAGLACGVKYPAVPMLVIAGAVACAAAGFIRRQAVPPLPEDQKRPHRFRGIMRPAVFGAVALVVFSPWLVRNAVWTGNPVFPLAMNTLGEGHFTDQQVERFEQAHAAPPERRSPAARAMTTISAFLFDGSFGYLFIPAVLVVLATGIRSRIGVFSLVMLGIILVVWLGFTHLIGRFLVLAIPLGGIALASMRLRREALFGGVVLLLVVSIVAFVQTHMPLLQAIVPFEGMTIGATDISPAELDTRRPEQRVALIGDAAAFIYHVPSSHLIYRTVFDLPAPAGAWYTAWTGGQAVDLLVINGPEVRRLHRTYAGVPDLPAGIPDDQLLIIPAPANASQP